MMFKILSVFIIIVILFLFIECKPVNESNFFLSKYKASKANVAKYNVPVLTFKQADDILSSFLDEENRKIEYKDKSLVVNIGNEALDYNMTFTFVFDDNKGTIYYLGCDKKILCEDFACNVNLASLESKGGNYLCSVKGYLMFNVDGEGCSFPFTITVLTDLNNIYKTTFEYKNNT